MAFGLKFGKMQFQLPTHMGGIKLRLLIKKLGGGEFTRFTGPCRAALRL